MKRLILDTNVLVRFLVQDDPKQSAGAAKLIATGAIRRYRSLFWTGWWSPSSSTC
jgi:predicted nucleic-acid-binding protein